MMESWRRSSAHIPTNVLVWSCPTPRSRRKELYDYELLAAQGLVAPQDIVAKQGVYFELFQVGGRIMGSNDLTSSCDC